MIQLAVHKTKTVLSLFVMLLIAGMYSYEAIPKESSPDIPIPVIYVSVHHEGISPEDAVSLLLKPLETELRSLEGLDYMEGTAYEGGANIVLNFQAGFDSDQALQDVREQVDRAKPELPAEADEPSVNEINISLFPILTVILGGDLPERELKIIAEDLQDTLESLRGVLEAKINGMREEMVLIEVDRAKLESFNITPQQLTTVIATNNQLVAAGSLELASGRYAVKVPGLFRSAEELLNLPLFTDGTRSVRVRDIADVKLTFKDATTITRVNGKPALTLEISKRLGENIIETVDAVKIVVAREQANWPASLAVSYTGDESVQTRTQLNDLQNNVVVAVFLVMVVILLALGPRGALLVASAVPGSFLTAIMILYALGFTTNVVVLFALILSVGLLVDGAVIVAEYADVQLNNGKRRKEAFIIAAQTMAAPVFSGTLTTLAAFLPLLFWPGIVGEFMKFMPITLIFTLSASLLMALIFLPTIGTVMPRPDVTAPPPEPRYAEVYARLVVKALQYPWLTLVSVVAIFVGSIVLYVTFGRGVEFFPRIEPERAQIVVHARGDLSIEQKHAIMLEVETLLLQLDGIETLYMVTGAGIGGGNRQGTSGDTIGAVLLEYTDWATGRPTSEEIMAEALALTGDMYGLRIEQQEQEDGPASGKPIKLIVSAPTYDILPPIVEDIRTKLAAVPGVINIEDNLPDPGIEWNLHIDRAEAARAGTNLAEIGTTIRLATNGAIVGTYRAADRNEEIDIVARYAESQRSLAAIDTLTIATPSGHVPIDHFTTREAQPKVTLITRRDQNNAATIEADVSVGVLANDVVTGLKAELANYPLPRGVSVVFDGEDADQNEASAFLEKAFAVAIFLMGIILVTQFNSFYQAFVVLFAVILSTTGVLLGHLLMDKPFGIIMSGLGVIALAGIVVNNNIVLIDTYNSLRRKLGVKAAIVETGRSRLRPVLLTTATTCIGLLPMAYKVNVDVINRTISYNAPSSQWWDQLASSVLYGLIFATILTLLVTPVLLYLKDRNQAPTG